MAKWSVRFGFAVLLLGVSLSPPTQTLPRLELVVELEGWPGVRMGPDGLGFIHWIDGQLRQRSWLSADRSSLITESLGYERARWGENGDVVAWDLASAEASGVGRSLRDPVPPDHVVIPIDATPHRTNPSFDTRAIFIDGLGREVQPGSFLRSHGAVGVRGLRCLYHEREIELASPEEWVRTFTMDPLTERVLMNGSPHEMIVNLRTGQRISTHRFYRGPSTAMEYRMLPGSPALIRSENSYEGEGIVFDSRLHLCDETGEPVWEFGRKPSELETRMDFDIRGVTSDMVIVGARYLETNEVCTRVYAVRE